MNFGAKIAEGTPREIQNHPEVLKAYLGEEEDE
jgi:branched-chain amino acid transport system ATP-binding protein